MKNGRCVLAFILLAFDFRSQAAIVATLRFDQECTCKVPQPCSCTNLLAIVPCLSEHSGWNECGYQGHNVSQICHAAKGRCSRVELVCEEDHTVCSSGMVSFANRTSPEPHIAAEILPDHKKKDASPKGITAEVVPKEASEVSYNNYLPSWDAFLAKPDEKAFAVGKLTKNLKTRPWAASWNHKTQHQANWAAITACERVAPKCRVAWPLRHVGESTRERKHWQTHFLGARLADSLGS